LFERLPRGWRLTEEGRELLPLAEAVESSTLTLERRAVSASGGCVRISAAPALVTHFLVPRLAPLLRAHPELTLELMPSRAPANLMRGDADIALRIGLSELPPGLVRKEVGRVGYGFYATPELLALPAAARPCIGFDESMRDTAQKHWLDAHAEGARLVLRSADMTVHLEAARAGLGVALLPHFLVDPAPGLVLVPASGQPFERPLSLLFHPDVRRAKRVVAVIRFLTEVTKREAPLLAGTLPRSSRTSTGRKKRTQKRPPVSSS
jgi:DNA-binding transcriptional LysR family regulator